MKAIECSKHHVHIGIDMNLVNIHPASQTVFLGAYRQYMGKYKLEQIGDQYLMTCTKKFNEQAFVNCQGECEFYEYEEADGFLAGLEEFKNKEITMTIQLTKEAFETIQQHQSSK